jgi:small subunit ribosomal protein S16
MPIKIRLARHGKKGKAFFHIVVADSRAPRDGRFIEKIGTYNPNTNPATIDIDTEKAFQWVNKGAQPTETTRAILSYKGVLYRNHLAKGVTKGALTVEQAESKLAAWMTQKESKIQSKVSDLSASAREAHKARLAAESKVKEAREKAISAKAEAQVEEAPEAPAQEEPSADSPQE